MSYHLNTENYIITEDGRKVARFFGPKTAQYAKKALAALKDEAVAKTEPKKKAAAKKKTSKKSSSS